MFIKIPVIEFLKEAKKKQSTTVIRMHINSIRSYQRARPEDKKNAMHGGWDGKSELTVIYAANMNTRLPHCAEYTTNPNISYILAAISVEEMDKQCMGIDESLIPAGY